MKLLHLITMSNQQFCLCDILFNVHDTLMKHALTLILNNKNNPLIYIGKNKWGFFKGGKQSLPSF